MHRPSLNLLLLSLTLGSIAIDAKGQQARQQVLVMAGGAIAQPARNEGDEGPDVEMFESPNLDRFLRRARQFLQEEKYQEAILVLQTVVEGRTLEAVEGGSGATGAAPEVLPPANGATPAADQPPAADAARRDAAALADPGQTVFSADGRIYRPARRLCHEYLCGMPEAGIELYRSMFEGRAQDLFRDAQRSGQVSDLERVANRYFPTLAAGRAMQALADRQMHEGRYRAAVQVLRDLAELYPPPNLRQLGISQLWCRFKIALCLRLAGEIGAALEAVRELAADFPEESLRVMGELHSVRELPASVLFAAGERGLVADIANRTVDGPGWLTPTTEELVPLWQYRFVGPDPYASVQVQSNRNDGFFGEATVANAAPPANKYGTGTQVAFCGRGFPAPRALFLENYRLRVADAFTGIVLLEGDGDAEPKKPQELRPRARVPVYDFTLLTPVEDDERYYAVLGRNKIDQSVDSLKVNVLVAYDKGTCQRVWSSDAYLDGADGLADVTILAAPTVFGERLLMPVLRRGAYALQCLDRRSGKPLWRTRVHAGGSIWWKAPGARVVVVGSLAYVLTNAGAIAAVDAFAGDLRWIRKYERSDPLRQKPIGRRIAGGQAGMFVNAMTFIERDLPGFVPSEVLTSGGTIIFAGCDGDMLLCIDGASGEPVWMIDGNTRYAPYGRIRYLVGTNERNLYVVAESEGDARTYLVCIEHGSGLIRWAREVPGGGDRLTRWRGRGCVLADVVCMPGDREVLALAADGDGEWRRLSLPAFGVGDEPLHGPNNLYSTGPWLGVAYVQGIEVYSTAVALRALATKADEPMRRAALQVQAGDIAAAVDTLAQWLQQPVADAALRRRGEEQLIALAREMALAQGAGGVAVLDRVLAFVTERPSRQSWHLARLDLFRQQNDLRAYEAEQQRLYRFMEGKD